MGKDYYAILGVPKTANTKDLKKAFRKGAMQWHPDKHTEPAAKAKAEEKFKDIAEAYDVLSDPKKKEIYDQVGEEGLKNGGAPTGGFGPGVNARFTTHYTGVDASDIFSRFFGNNANFFDDEWGFATDRRKNGRQQTPDSQNNEIELSVSLEDVYKGATKRMKVNRARFTTQGIRRDEDTILNIDVKPGWKDGTKITFNGEGQQDSPHQKPGNLIFLLRIVPHPRFSRQDDHLIYTAKISLRDCFIGTTVEIDTLDGRKLRVDAPSIITPKTRRVIAREGMPCQKTTGRRGDLIVEFEIVFPT
ncbi:chaperone DnaJ [Gregarina niphandrodes]|uniref:Chaperone DnaJ n=1 Tax=Gregarina niphandrodes TaxID=110365 RepID=A0A023B0N7_GRENI|nr:chaperone DnaJ [Gregarina niphandrodes]EZG45539.1 chaperone DnaJ [Gregarina niphandrodes]|eukprot:XP_011132476.1 chaperone DnaJ [Gregarina niphandrodes]